MLDSQPKGDDGLAVAAELDLTAGAGEAAREEDETRKKVSLSEGNDVEQGGRLRRSASSRNTPADTSVDEVAFVVLPVEDATPLSRSACRKARVREYFAGKGTRQTERKRVRRCGKNLSLTFAILLARI